MVRELTTKRMYLALERRVSKDLLENMMESVRVRADDSGIAFVTDEVVLQFVAIFQGCAVHEQVMDSRRVPRTWWDAVKERWCPAWLIRKGWVRVDTDNVSKLVQHWHVCPHLHAEKRETHIRFLSDDFQVRG